MGANRRPWVTYRDPVETARAQARELRPRVDVLVAVTHLPLDQDQRLAESAPEIDLVLGGHEHENWQIRRGPRFTPIVKADANARTVYVHRLVYDTGSRRLSVRSDIRRVGPEIPEHAATARVVREWTERGFQAFRAQGFAPEERVAESPVVLDGREASVRSHPTHLTDLVAESALRTWPGAELAIVNAGSIRIDDEIPPGPITQYDVLRILPFGGRLVGVEASGVLLARVLDAGWANRGRGGFLQWANVEPLPDPGWKVGGKRLDPEVTYRVVLPDFLLTGGEQGIEFLTREAIRPGGIVELGDVRFALIEELRRRWPVRP